MEQHDMDLKFDDGADLEELDFDPADIELQDSTTEQSQEPQKPAPKRKGRKGEKRKHHNALERKRRDHIRYSFNGLRDSIPRLQGNEKASRSKILLAATDYILQVTDCAGQLHMEMEHLTRTNMWYHQQIGDLKEQMNAN
eukprot:Clim_evm2s143 gene=Clim_evmTU2s143